MLTLLAFPLLQNFRSIFYLNKQQDDGNNKILRLLLDHDEDAAFEETEESVDASIKKGGPSLNILQGVDVDSSNNSTIDNDSVEATVSNVVVQHQCKKDDIPTDSYTVCNGLSNQLAGHAAYIADLIKSGRKVAIPDAFIFNGVQDEKNKDGHTLKNVVANTYNDRYFSISTGSPSCFPRYSFGLPGVS